MSDLAEIADVVVVGGGSAGAVLAARLSQDPERTVLLLEAGPAYAPKRVPADVAGRRQNRRPVSRLGLHLTRHRTDTAAPDPAGQGTRWQLRSECLRGAAGPRRRLRQMEPARCPRLVVRGRAPGLHVAGEHSHRRRYLSRADRSATDPAAHGRRPDAVSAGFIAAAAAQGFNRVRDFNGAEQNGVGGYPVDVVDGIRQNVGMVYLTAEVRGRPNLTIRGDVNIDRVLFDGTTATGVLAADGTVYRGHEVILCGGAYGSPAILLRSGLGPADDLTALGIKVVADLPVGRRLQDQPGYYNAYALAPGRLEMTPAVGSLLWTASTEAVGDELDLHVTATHLMDGSYSPTGGAIVVMAALVQPESTGTLKLASPDPDDAPLIDANYLGTGRDARRLLEGVKLGRSIAHNPIFAPYVAAELTPGDAVADDDTLAQVIASNVAVYGHPTSTVPMGGPGDPWAVVDSVGAVDHVSGLRVVDASIIPEVPSSATNVTVIMLAERIYQRVYAT